MQVIVLLDEDWSYCYCDCEHNCGCSEKYTTVREVLLVPDDLVDKSIDSLREEWSKTGPIKEIKRTNKKGVVKVYKYPQRPNTSFTYWLQDAKGFKAVSYESIVN